MNATCTANPVGVGPMHYAWYEYIADTPPVVSTTASYTIADLLSKRAGWFFVRATGCDVTDTDYGLVTNGSVFQGWTSFWRYFFFACAVCM
jgi:hypothetical protein